jgi:hypothetical protein
MGNLWLYAHPAAFWAVIAVAILGIATGVTGLYHHYNQR